MSKKLKIKRKINAEKQIDFDNVFKKCSKCGEIKNGNEFHRSNECASLLRSVCKNCENKDKLKYYYRKSNYQVAFGHFVKALKIHRILQNQYGMAVAINGIGIVYEAFGDYSNSLKFHKEALTLMTKINNYDGIAGSLGNIAKIYFTNKMVLLAIIK